MRHSITIIHGQAAGPGTVARGFATAQMRLWVDPVFPRHSHKVFADWEDMGMKKVQGYSLLLQLISDPWRARLSQLLFFVCSYESYKHLWQIAMTLTPTAGVANVIGQPLSPKGECLTTRKWKYGPFFVKVERFKLTCKKITWPTSYVMTPLFFKSSSSVLTRVQAWFQDVFIMLHLSKTPTGV